MFVINHYVYKSMLFLAVGGVYKRTHTKLMYKMGGLITIMPFTFVSVLVGIIAMSGVPPLSGYGGRWLFYNAILDGSLRLPLILIFMAGPIAFLYLFRLIHAVFLGQLKDEHRNLKEAPFWLVLPQMFYVAFLIAFAVLPGMMLQQVDAYIGTIFGDKPLIWGGWGGREIFSEFGYWNPVAIWLVIARGLRFGLPRADRHEPQRPEGEAVQHRVCRRAPVQAADHAFRLELLCPLPQGDGHVRGTGGHDLLDRGDRHPRRHRRVRPQDLFR